MAGLLEKAQSALKRMDANEALSLAKSAKSSDQSVEIGALEVMVDAHMMADEIADARKVAKEMLAFAQQDANQDGEGRAWVALASVYLAQEGGETDAAEAADKARSIFSNLKGTKGQVRALTASARAQIQLDRAKAGVDAAQEAVSLARGTNETMELANALEVLVQAFAAQGNPVAGLKAANKELTSLQQAGNRSGEASVHAMLANTHAMLGEPRGALKNAKAARDIYMSLGDMINEASMHHVIAEMLRATDDRQEATREAEKALALFKQERCVGGQEQVLDTLSALLCERGQPEKAPKRPDALKALKELVRTIEKRDAANLKAAEEKVGIVSKLLTDNDYADVLHAYLHSNPDAVAFLEEQGWVFKRESRGAMHMKTYPHRAFYLHMVMTGMGFGPQFRGVNPYRVSYDAGGTPVALSCTQLAETEAWQMEMGYRPGILDASLQCSAVMAFP